MIIKILYLEFTRLISDKPTKPMKNILLPLGLLAFAVMPLHAQTASSTAPETRAIYVTGIAEMEIIPDEIYINVTLREFTKDKKKYGIEELESAFLHFVETTTSTPQTDVKMDNTDARIIAMKRKQKDAIIEKSYELKYKNNEQVMLLFTASDSLSLSNVYIKRYSHSKIEDYKQQVRVKAVLNAKDKATYMLAALGQKPGNVLTLTEINPSVTIDDGVDNDFRPFRGNVYNRSNGDSMGATGWSYNDADEGGFEISDSNPIVKTIKLRYEVSVKFEIV
jgi:hypothetical protein